LTGDICAHCALRRIAGTGPAGAGKLCGLTGRIRLRTDRARRGRLGRGLVVRWRLGRGRWFMDRRGLGRHLRRCDGLRDRRRWLSIHRWRGSGCNRPRLRQLRHGLGDDVLVGLRLNAFLRCLLRRRGLGVARRGCGGRRGGRGRARSASRFAGFRAARAAALPCHARHYGRKRST